MSVQSDRSQVVLDTLATVGRSVPALLAEALDWKSGEAAVRTELKSLEERGHVRHVTPAEGGPSAGRTLWEITDAGKSEVR